MMIEINIEYEGMLIVRKRIELKKESLSDFSLRAKILERMDDTIDEFEAYIDSLEGE